MNDNATATIIKECSVYELPDSSAKIIGKLAQGTFVRWTAEKRLKNKQTWLEVLLPSDQKGYVFADDTFKWEKYQLRNTSLKMILEGSEKEIWLNKGDVVYKIYPDEKPKKGEPESTTMTLADANSNIGKVKYASLKGSGMETPLIIVAALGSTLITGYLVYWAIVVMILGGRIFFGGLVVAALLFVWKFIFAIIISLLKSIQSSILRLKLNS